MKGPQGKYAWMARVGEKGQIVIPKEARELFGISPGDTLLLLGDPKKGLVIPGGNRFEELASRLFGEIQAADGEEEV